MGCGYPSCLGQPKTIQERLDDREEKLNEAKRELLRLAQKEKLGELEATSACASALRNDGDEDLARTYAEQALRHRENIRLLARAGAQLTTIIGALNVVGHQVEMERALAGFGSTLRLVNERMPEGTFSRLARFVGVQLNQIDRKRQDIATLVEQRRDKRKLAIEEIVERHRPDAHDSEDEEAGDEEPLVVLEESLEDRMERLRQ